MNIDISNRTQAYYIEPKQDNILMLDEIMTNKEVDYTLSFGLMYEEWKQKILLSDGLNEDENFEW